MRRRITELVNSVLSEEAGTGEVWFLYGRLNTTGSV